MDRYGVSASPRSHQNFSGRRRAQQNRQRRKPRRPYRRINISPGRSGVSSVSAELKNLCPGRRILASSQPAYSGVRCLQFGGHGCVQPKMQGSHEMREQLTSHDIAPVASCRKMILSLLGCRSVSTIHDDRLRRLGRIDDERMPFVSLAIAPAICCPDSLAELKLHHLASDFNLAVAASGILRTGSTLFRGQDLPEGRGGCPINHKAADYKSRDKQGNRPSHDAILRQNHLRTDYMQASPDLMARIEAGLPSNLANGPLLSVVQDLACGIMTWDAGDTAAGVGA